MDMSDEVQPELTDIKYSEQTDELCDKTSIMFGSINLG